MRPILGEQLEKMRAWLPSLNSSNNDAMKQIGSELALKIKEADLAVQKLREAEQELNDFLAIGDRQTLFNEYNELRSTIYKGIEATNPGLGDAFFLHDTSQRSLSLDAMLKYTQARVDRLSTSLAEEQERLDELKAKKAARDNQEEARLAAIKKLAELKEQTKQLKAEIKSTPKKKKR
jgi:DNA repair exonuclease SbcCD ATPase subunit